MSKWRPSKSCLYVIPDIHGSIELLNQCLKRILPLRKRDEIIFLGDYIDRHPDSHLVIDRVIEIKETYKERATCLMGNHELMLLTGLGLEDDESEEASAQRSWGFGQEANFEMWKEQGGYQTILGYLRRNEMIDDVIEFSKNRYAIRRIIPQKHIDFMKSLQTFYEKDDFIFVHGGCHPANPPSQYSRDVICWDRTLIKLVRDLLQAGENLPWEKCIITGHNRVPVPLIADKFMALDTGSPKQLILAEVRSREAFIAYPGQTRMVSCPLTNTKMTKKPGLIRRSS